MPVAGPALRTVGRRCASAIVLAASLAGAPIACGNLVGLDHYTPCTRCTAAEAAGQPHDDAAADTDATPDDDVAVDDATDGGDARLVDRAMGTPDAMFDADAAGRDAAFETSGSDGPTATDATGDVNEIDASDAPTDTTPDGTGSTLDMGLVAYYAFDETSGTTAADSSGNGHDATLSGGATFSAGLRNNAVTLSGNRQYVALPANILGGLTSFSVTAWVNLGSTPTWARIFDFGTGTTVYTFLTANAGKACRFAITTATNAGEQQVDGTAILPTGSWQHVAVTLGSGTATLYVQGAEVGHNSGVSLTAASLGSTTQDWLGRSEFSVDPYLTGQIDNVRIYSRALTAAEVQTLYSSQL